jgi:sec-independent protein translocase protein TatA
MLIPLLLEGEELLIVAVIVVVLIFGAGKIPEIAKSLGRASGEFEKGKVEGELEIQRLRNSAGQLQSPASDEHLKLVKAASAMNLPTEGLTDDQLRAELKTSFA